MKAPPDWLYGAAPILACAGGSVDATAYMTLGKVFPANMTGNTVLLAIATANLDLGSIQRAGVVLLAFCVGVCLGAGYLRDRAAGWQGHVTAMFMLEALLLAGVASCVCVWGPQPAGSLAVLFLGAASALAMGIQSAVVRHLRIGHLRTTFIAGPLVEALASCLDRADSRSVREPTRGILAGTYIAYICAALAAALTSRYWPRLAMFLPLLALFVLLLYRMIERGPRHSHSEP